MVTLQMHVLRFQRKPYIQIQIMFFFVHNISNFLKVLRKKNGHIKNILPSFSKITIRPGLTEHDHPTNVLIKIMYGSRRDLLIR